MKTIKNEISLNVPRMSAVFVLLALFHANVFATNVYVVPPGTIGVAPDGLYQTWATAATNIQDAVNAINITDGNTVFITNGIYLLTNQITVDKGVVLRSYKNGATAPEETILDGDAVSRCLYLNHPDIVVDGLTLSNGLFTSNYGGGIFVPQGRMVTNCIIVGNISIYGGGIYSHAPDFLLTHSQVRENTATSSSGGGVGIQYGRIEFCGISNNVAQQAGGGVSLRDAELRNSVVYSNRTVQAPSPPTAAGSGGGVRIRGTGIVENCLIYNNLAGRPGGGGVWVNNDGNTIIRNCTIASNSTVDLNWHGGGMYVHGTATVVNCIIYDNTGYQTASNYFFRDGSEVISIDYSCLAPTNDLPGNIGNIDLPPGFVGDGDYRLQRISPCINAGVYQDWMDDAVDLDGNPRIDAMYGLVDIGCYEYMFRGTVFRFR